MALANIFVNGVDGSNDDLTINTLVTLTNTGDGTEVTWVWSILDQPDGATDSLTGAGTATATFTPKKEGTYVIQLQVNGGISTDRVACAVRQIKTRERIPGAYESTEDEGRGWAGDLNNILRRVDDRSADPGKIVVYNNTGATLSGSEVLRITSTQVIKPGLPGHETIPSVQKIGSVTELQQVDETLCVFVGAVVSGGIAAGNVTNGALCEARLFGKIIDLPAFGGTAVSGAPIYVGPNSSIYTVASMPGIPRQIGHVVKASGSTMDVWFNGMSNLTATGSFDLVNVGLPESLINANARLRVFDANESAITTRESTNDVEATLMSNVAGGHVATRSVHNLHLGTSNAVRWVVSASGHMYPNADNTFDFGLSSGNRVRDVYAIRFQGASNQATFTWASDTDTYITNTAANDITFVGGGAARWSVDSSGHWTPGAHSTYDIGSLTTRVRTGSFGLVSATGSIAIGMSSEPATRFHMRGSTDANSYARIDSSDGLVQAICGTSTVSGFFGTLSDHTFDLRTNNTARWIVNTSGHFLPSTTGIYDLGSTSNRIRSGTFNRIEGGDAIIITSDSITRTIGALRLGADAAVRWQVNSSAFQPETDNLYDLGALGGPRVRSGYFANSVRVGTAITASSAGLINIDGLQISNSSNFLSVNTGYLAAGSAGFRISGLWELTAASPLVVNNATAGRQEFISAPAAATSSADALFLSQASRTAGRLLSVLTGTFGSSNRRMFDITFDGRAIITAPATAPASADLFNGTSAAGAAAGSISWWIDEANNQLKCLVKYSNGTTVRTFTGTLP